MSFFNSAASSVHSLLAGKFVARTLGFSIFGTGSYVLYKDMTRYPRMEYTFSRGNVLPPLADNVNEISYFSRPSVEDELRTILSPTFTNEYYLIHGEIGTGKTRTILEIVRAMHQEQVTKREGAPIYVLASQGKSFPETLAEAVNFHFDEYLSFRHFMDFLLKVRSFPRQDIHNRLDRVLQAIEEAAFQYAQKGHVPMVLVIDGTDTLDRHLPGSLAKLQDKAKLWADTNIAKVIFMSNDEETEELFKGNPGNWSRMGSSYRMGDLTKEESIRFLCTTTFMETPKRSRTSQCALSAELAQQVYDLVGGRIRHLITFKREFLSGVPFEVTAARLERKERDKFVHVEKTPLLLEIVERLKHSSDYTQPMSSLVSATSRDCVMELAKCNVVRLERNSQGVQVTFESKLTANVALKLKTAR